MKILTSVTSIVFQSIYIIDRKWLQFYNVLKTNLVDYTVIVVNYTVVAIDSFMMWLCGKP